MVFAKVVIMNNKLYPFQELMLEKMRTGTEFKIMSSGRHVGKSMVTAQAIERLMRDINSQPLQDLVLSEGKVYGARYYCVEPIGGNWMEMESWCLDSYGNPGQHIWGDDKAPEPQQRWYMNNRKFWFRNERDRNWFIMKWSSQ